MTHDLVTELLQYSSLACFMAIWQLCANLLIPNCLRSNLSYSPLAALELYVKLYKTLNDMAKIQIKSEKLTPFGGIFSIMEQFDALLAQTIDSTLGLRCTMFGYQYSEILRSLFQQNGLRRHVGMY